ncbi:hypothetical protein FDB34_02060 [Clostridium botulinum]|nr:hypothetical protein [Clostridium botulinum]
MFNSKNLHATCIDDKNNLYFIDHYLVLNKNGIDFNTYCPFCHKSVYVKCANNPTRRTHFAHKQNESCSSVNYTDRFSNTYAPPTSLEVENLKVLLLLYSNVIYNYITNTLRISITVTQYLNALSSIDKKVFHYKDIPLSSFTYIIINNLKSTPSRTFLFSSTDTSNDLWEFCGYKNVLYILDYNKKQIINTINTDFDYLDNYTPHFDSSFLNIAYTKLIETLSLDSQIDCLILNIILNNYI